MTLEDRFYDKVEYIPGVECENWGAYLDPAGYGRFNLKGRKHYKRKNK